MLLLVLQCPVSAGNTLQLESHDSSLSERIFGRAKGAQKVVGPMLATSNYAHMISGFLRVLLYRLALARGYCSHPFPPSICSNNKKNIIVT